jgi:1,4-dihydroxy-2-naphthoate octaprenyltransferase
MPSSKSASPTSPSSRASPNRGTAAGWRVWWLAARPATLPAAVAPVLVGTATAAQAGKFHGLAALAALAVAVLVQVGTNLSNDAHDFLRGADHSLRTGPLRVTAAGLLTPRQVLAGAWAAFGLACAAGLYLVWLRGWPLALVGLSCVAAGMSYTAGPRFGYRGLGDLFVFVFFGLVAVVGTDYVQTGSLRAEAVWAAFPVGLTCTAILVVNNLRDIPTDAAAGKRTLAVRLGPRGTRWEYTACWLGALGWPWLMRGQLGTDFWLPWLVTPLVGWTAWRVWTQDGRALNRALKDTARLHLAYGVLLAVSLVR